MASEVEVPDPDPERWQEQIKDVSARFRASCSSTATSRARASRTSRPGHNTMIAIDRMIAILLAGGLPKQVVAYAIDVLPQFVTVSAYEHSLFARRLQTDPEYFDRLNDYYASLPPERFPHVHAMLPQLDRAGRLARGPLRVRAGHARARHRGDGGHVK